MYIQRQLHLESLLGKKTIFLFGPRQTGKSTLIKNELNDFVHLTYNLLDRNLFLRLSADLSLIRKEIRAKKLQDGVVVIDEIQRLPELLDEVHLLMEETNIKFLLTGSSARKLRQRGVNLLGGRGIDRKFHPFVFQEVKNTSFSLEKTFYSGMIPSFYLSDDPNDDLASYVGRYLTEEIAAEGLTRNIPAFSRFLEVAAAASGQLINYSNLANDAQIKRQTIQNYFQILYDTLLGFELAPYLHTDLRKPITTAKFYLFDLGVVRTLRKIGKVQEGSKDFGDFLEHFIFHELLAYRDYYKPQDSLNFWRSKSGFEVDFIAADKAAIEVKATKYPYTRDLKGIKALREERPHLKGYLVCQVERAQLVDDVLCLPWMEFLEALWQQHVF